MKLIDILFIVWIGCIKASAQEFVTTYDSGKPHIYGFYNKETGKREGRWIWFERDGTKEAECDYVDGKIEGLYIKYDWGQIDRVEEYRNGKKNGITTEYYFRRNIKDPLRKCMEKTYVDDVLEGPCRQYDQQGRITKRYRVHNDAVVADSLFAPDGFMYQTRLRVEAPETREGFRYITKTYRRPGKRSTAARSKLKNPANAAKPVKKKLTVNNSGVIDLK